MDIGTAKPTEEERGRVPHHMFDVVDPDESYTCAQYKDDAARIIDAVHARGRVPIVCGGTGLYARALLEGLSIPPVPPQPELRSSLAQFADEHGNERLHDRLKELDPSSASRLSVNDRFRVVRAIEVCTVLGIPFSQAASKQPPAFNTIWIGLTVEDRSYLKRAIEKRLQAQLKAGLIEEAARLYHRYGCARALMNTVNYREFIDHFTGLFSFEQALEECIRHNYQLARRQIMWFKTNIAINWFTIDTLSSAELFDRVRPLLSTKTLSG
jgi:tRNA dimethylallyltransferase